MKKDTKPFTYISNIISEIKGFFQYVKKDHEYQSKMNSYYKKHFLPYVRKGEMTMQI